MATLCPHALPLPLFGLGLRLKKMRENTVNAALVSRKGFAPATLAAYYWYSVWDDVALMKKLSRACCVEQVRHTFTILPS